MYLRTLGELALGSRLKAISDHLYDVADAVYAARGIGIQARWFPLLKLLAERGPLPVGDIAQALGFTHPAISQLATRLEAAGWVQRRADRADKRRSLLALTPRAEAELATLPPVWDAIRTGAAGAVQRSGADLMAALAAFEAELARAPLTPQILRSLHAADAARVRIEPYRPELAPAFYRLNAEWLEKHFSIEDLDRTILGDPEGYILARGGAIFFAVLDGEVLGTCALLCESEGVYELGKMAVTERYQGLGLGRRLLEAALKEFHARQGRRLFLESNSALAPALKLYEQMGFVHQPATRPDSHYRRANVYMVYGGGGQVAA